MIKVNLLDSVTDKSAGFAAVEARVASPRAQGKLMLIAVVALTALGMFFDYSTANSAKAAAQAQLEEQQRVAAQMELVKREQAELEKKTQDVQARIDVIKRLRDSQQGPVGVLSAINERLPKLQDFRLAGIEQKDGSLTITGDSPSEEAVTQFGRSLEFSSGMFANVSIETKRELLKPPPDMPTSADSLALDKDDMKPQTVSFTVRCKYSPAGTQPASANKPAAGTPPANQVAQK
ncbi:MAG TPA: PilN domain-containing protein [Pyrinomonadaceae bacterium]|jgi:Tfp pilus assembly protein PilN